MYFFATGTIHHPEQIGALMAEESRVLDELRAERVVLQAFRRVTGGVVSFVEGPDLATVEAAMGRLPFLSSGAMTFEYAEVVPL
jgi:hypothetical protein